MKSQKMPLDKPLLDVRVNPEPTPNYDEQPFIKNKIARAKEILAIAGHPRTSAAKKAS